MGDTNQIIKDGVNGILLRRPAPQAICEAVVELKRNDDFRNKLISGTKAASKEFISWNERLTNEINEINNLIKRG